VRRLVTNRKRSRVDPIELVVLGVFAATSVWVLALGLWWTVTEGRIWTGVNGVYVQDVTQYLAWIRDASRHVLVSDLFVLRASPHDYLQPAIAISGGLVAFGIAPWLGLALWQPVAVGGAFLAVRALVHGQLDERLGRRAALVLGLFGASIGTFQDLWLPWWTWGYVFGVLSLAAMVASLVLYERALRGAAPVWPAAVLAGLSSWLHPWQGAVLALIIAGAEVVLSTQPAWSPGAPRRRSLWRPGLVLVAISLPLAYYAVLDRADPAWRLGEQSLAGAVPAWRVLLMLAPLVTPALLAYRLRPLSFTAAALRVWPPAAFAVYVAGDHGLGNEPMHAFLGISIPLAILAVQGVGSLCWRSTTPRRTLAMLVVSALTVPQAVSELTDKWRFVRPSTAPITVSDWQAIDYLGRDPQPGGVLAAFPLGRYIPGETGRRTYVGDVFWSEPHPKQREAEVARLLAGRLSPVQAQRFVAATGARFLLADCTTRADLGRELAPIIACAHRFGCAAVYGLMPQARARTLRLPDRGRRQMPAVSAPPPRSERRHIAVTCSPAPSRWRRDLRSTRDTCICE
jgi:hypothetical protein